MINRELTKRENEICEMIPDIENVTFRDLVFVVRKDVDQTRYQARKRLKSLHT